MGYEHSGGVYPPLLRGARGPIRRILLEGSWYLLTNYNCTYNISPLSALYIVIIWVISTVITYNISPLSALYIVIIWVISTVIIVYEQP